MLIVYAIHLISNIYNCIFLIWTNSHLILQVLDYLLPDMGCSSLYLLLKITMSVLKVFWSRNLQEMVAFGNLLFPNIVNCIGTIYVSLYINVCYLFHCVASFWFLKFIIMLKSTISIYFLHLNCLVRIKILYLIWNSYRNFNQNSPRC